MKTLLPSLGPAGRLRAAGLGLLLGSRSMRTLAIATALSVSTQAEVITGQVLDDAGLPVASVNIDVFDGAGNELLLTDDGTDVNGFFTTTVPSAGIFTVSFRPPPPPTTTHLRRDLASVVIVGTTNIGTVTLPPGYRLLGRVLRTGGLPVGGVQIETVPALTGVRYTPENNLTDGFGNYSVAVPRGEIELRFDATDVITPVLVSLAIPMNMTANVNIGDRTLIPGFRVSGTVRRADLTPVAGADIDAEDVATGEKIYTPGDNTNPSGAFSVVVPPGTFEVEVCPEGNDLLVADVQIAVVASNVTLPVFTLQSGVILFGLVSGSGSPVAGVDLDVIDTVSGLPVTTCNDNTAESGVYGVVVPNGTYDLSFRPPLDTAFATTRVNGVVVAGMTQVNVALDACPPATSYGVGLAGTGGAVPVLSSTGGPLRAGNSEWAWTMDNLVGGGIGILFASTQPANLPFFGGTILINPSNAASSRFPFFANGSVGVGGVGSAQVAFPVAPSSVVGLTLFNQFGVLDPGAVSGVSLSNGLEVSICP